MPALLSLLKQPGAPRQMANIFSNPESSEQILSKNPALCQMFDSNPQLREAMTKPEFYPHFVQQLQQPPATPSPPRGRVDRPPSSDDAPDSCCG